MQAFIYDLLFIIASILILFKAIGYGIYEIKEMKNKPGGISIISLSILITIFFNFVIFIK